MSTLIPVAIRQTIRGVTAHTLNPNGSYERCIVNHETSQGDVILTAIMLAGMGYGRQFRLDLMGAHKSISCLPTQVSGVVNTRGLEWDVVPFDCLVNIPNFNRI